MNTDIVTATQRAIRVREKAEELEEAVKKRLDKIARRYHFEQYGRIQYGHHNIAGQHLSAFDTGYENGEHCVRCQFRWTYDQDEGVKLSIPFSYLESAEFIMALAE